jgi:hypothetical protein
MLSLVTCLIFIPACQENNTSKNAGKVAGIDIDSLTAAIKELSSDSFEGRKPFTRGETIN